MACTLLRIVQAAVSLRRRFECAIHSSFESESGAEEQRDRDQQDEEHAAPRPRAEDLSTSEHLSRTFRLTFEEEDAELNAIDAVDADTMTFLPAESQEGAEGGAAYTDAPASTSIDILEESRFSSPDTPEDNTPALPTHALESHPCGDSPTPPEALPSPVFPHVAQAPSPDMPDSPSSPLPGLLPAPAPPLIPEPIPRVQVHEVSGSERSSSDSESSSDSRCSVKSVRLRDAVSPSSGCKPAKLIRSDAMVSSAEREASGSLRWVLTLEETGPATLKEGESQSGEEEKQEEEIEEEEQEGRRDSDCDRTELLAYSEWLLKGKQTLELDSSSGDDNEDRTMSDEDDGEEDEEEIDYDDFDFEDDDSDEDYLADEGEVVAEASFEDSFVDDGFVSLEVDDYDEDIIIEENEEDLERERMEEEMMLEIRRNLQER